MDMMTSLDHNHSNLSDWQIDTFGELQNTKQALCSLNPVSINVYLAMLLFDVHRKLLQKNKGLLTDQIRFCLSKSLIKFHFRFSHFLLVSQTHTAY